MKILLLTRNHVVKEFIEIVANRINATLVVYAVFDESIDGVYDFLIIDDRGTLLEKSITLLESIKIGKSIVLYSEEREIHNQFDTLLKKPFLPSEIQTILEKPLKRKKRREDQQVLNIQDIDEIKDLLEGEKLEIIFEEDLVDEIASGILPQDEQPTPIVEEKIKQEERILQAITKMEPKKIRKLLKGAEVTIHIRFPKEQE